SLKWTRVQLNGGQLTRQRRKASSWNAFVSIKLNEVNETRGPGERYRLPAFIAANHAQLRREYGHLPEAEKTKLRLSIDKLRVTRINIVHSNPKALIKDINSTFSTMEKEVSLLTISLYASWLSIMQWSAINACTSVEGFYIAVQGDLEHYHEAKIFLTPKAKSFIKDVLHFEPKHLALKFESWVVGDFSTRSLIHHFYISERRNGQHTFRIISMCYKQDHKLASRKVLMNYDNYEKKIVEVYAVAIDG
ncbi:hypothetical protein F4604DRAFT_1538497, partial [Suillus subluteus]